MARSDTRLVLHRARIRARLRLAAAAVALGVVVAILLTAVAGAGPNRQATVTSADNNLWATVNFCHGKRAKPSMGVRARMPADSPGERLFMRFYAQYRKDGQWHGLDHSGWRYVGSGQMWWEDGWKFGVTKPAAGHSFLMRGLVRYRWKLNGEIVRRAKRYTTGGHPTGTAKHPYSSATCRIYGPTQGAGT